ncbi:MAG TPA: MMPL family transporter [Gaiellales bacterium]|nr:MMPL family transporter [Gaiellales bacterium]
MPAQRFASLGRWVYRRRRVVVGLWLAAVAVLAPLAPQLQGILASGGFIAQDSEAVQAGNMLYRWLPQRPRSELIVVAPNGNVADLRRTIAPLVRFPHVVLPPTGPHIVRSGRGHVAYAAFPLDVDPDTARAYVERFRAALRPPPGFAVDVTGPPAVFEDIQLATSADLRRAESIGIPAALIVLALAFGTAVAAGIPLVVGGVAVLTTLGLLWMLAHQVPLSIFVLNIATMLGLGVGVDYALLAVSRFREELRAGKDVEAAVVRTVETAGRAIAFSGLAVLIGLSGMWAFGLRVLSSIAAGGTIVVAVSALAAVTLLPAILGMLGPRVERAPLLPRRRGREGVGSHFWERLARTVMARPWTFIVTTLAIIGVLAAPVLSATLNVARADVLPTRFDSRQGEQLLDTDFSQAALNPIVVVVKPGVPLQPLVHRLVAVPGVARVARVERGPRGSAIDLTPAVSPFTDAGRAVVDRIRALPGHGPQFLVTGETAGELDFLAQIKGRAPWAAAFIILATYFVLALAFRSVLLPVKAIVMNSLSIAGAFGVLVWVFQDGHLDGFLGLTRLGYIESTMPVVIVCTLFGVSMDYEVFMLSRIAEAYRAGASNRDAVATGLVATGRIITSAASILVVVGLAFTTADVVIVKELGLGLALAIGLDATLIRSLLVPATMRVLGDWNWWPSGRSRRAVRGLKSTPAHVED